jgi:hypothetical protein
MTGGWRRDGRSLVAPDGTRRFPDVAEPDLRKIADAAADAVRACGVELDRLSRLLNVEVVVLQPGGWAGGRRNVGSRPPAPKDHDRVGCDSTRVGPPRPRA